LLSPAPLTLLNGHGLRRNSLPTIFSQTKTLLQQKTEEWKAATAKVSQMQKDMAEASNLHLGVGSGYGFGGLVEQTRGFDQNLKEAQKDADKLRDEVVKLQNQVGAAGLVGTKAQIDAAKEAQKEAEKADKDWLAGRFQMWADDDKRSRESIEATNERIKKMREEAKQLTEVIGIVSAAAKGPMDDLQKLNEQMVKTLESERAQEQAIATASRIAGDSQLVTEQKLAILRKETVKQLQPILIQLRAIAELSKDPALIEEAKKYGAELDKLKVKVQSLADVMKVDVKNQFKGAFTDIILQTKSVSEAFRQMAASIIADLVRMILEMYVF
jgi:hypothetical protein